MLFSGLLLYCKAVSLRFVSVSGFSSRHQQLFRGASRLRSPPASAGWWPGCGDAFVPPSTDTPLRSRTGAPARPAASWRRTPASPGPLPREAPGPCGHFRFLGRGSRQARTVAYFRVLNCRGGVTVTAALFRTTSPLAKFPPLAVARGSPAAARVIAQPAGVIEDPAPLGQSHVAALLFDCPRQCALRA